MRAPRTISGWAAVWAAGLLFVALGLLLDNSVGLAVGVPGLVLVIVGGVGVRMTRRRAREETRRKPDWW